MLRHAVLALAFAACTHETATEAPHAAPVDPWRERPAENQPACSAQVKELCVLDRACIWGGDPGPVGHERPARCMPCRDFVALTGRSLPDCPR